MKHSELGIPAEALEPVYFSRVAEPETWEPAACFDLRDLVATTWPGHDPPRPPERR